MRKSHACSWRDMRRIQHILARQEKLRGEYTALMRCSDKRTRNDWKRSLEVLDACNGLVNQTEHLQPTHATVIARGAPREDWPAWVARCEAERWTIKLESFGKAIRRR